MDYEPLLKLPSGTDDIEYLFKTERPNRPEYAGSTYAHHSDSTTTGYREPSNRKGGGHEIQPRSGKTVFMAPQDRDQVAGIFQNTEMATKFVPEMDKNNKPTGQAQLVLTEDYGPKKAGTVIARVPYATIPKVGLSPVEINKSDSPMGSSGSGIHFGNPITEVHPRPERLKKAPSVPLSGGRGGGGMGGSMTSKLNPMSLQNLYAQGGAIKMPSDYSLGGWKLI